MELGAGLGFLSTYCAKIMGSDNVVTYEANPALEPYIIEGGEYELIQYADLHNIEKIIMEIHKSVIGAEKIKFVLSQFKDKGFKIDPKLSTQRELYLEKKIVENHTH